MAGTPTYAVPSSFLGVSRTDASADYVIAGIPMDIGTTNRSGTRDGPAAIRRANRMLTDGEHPQHWVEPAGIALSDIGDFSLALGDIPASLALIKSQDSADEMRGPFMLPADVSEGDWIEIGQLGACGACLCTAFNGFDKDFDRARIIEVGDKPMGDAPVREARIAA